MEERPLMSATSAGTVSSDLDAEQNGLTVNDRLALIGLISEGARQRSAHSPIVADLFEKLSDLVSNTVSGAKIDRLDAGQEINGFKVIEINSESGENLGRLHMLYLNKPIPCYYLVYVEVAAPFRNKGLGNRILKAYRDFLIEKSAVGILDNIIPEDDPTFDIYRKLDWKPAEEVGGSSAQPRESMYMAFIPPAFAERDLRDQILRLIHHLERRRPAIDMRDNELMVRRTIDEFRDLYAALLTYFGDQILAGEHDSLMRFMFTRFVTKLLGFRRRIGQLLGYTGGESLEQIVLHPEIRTLPVQSYAPRELADTPCLAAGDPELWLRLPEQLKMQPARVIESLPNYRRPNLVSWLEENGKASDEALTLGDLMDLGFDPTRLKEFSWNGRDFIIERVQGRMVPHVKRRKEILDRVGPETAGTRLRNARLWANAPLLVVADRGNGYVLRPKVAGIHWEEAVDQLQRRAHLKELNKTLKIEKLITTTVRGASAWLKERLVNGEQGVLEGFSYFVSWDLDKNHPALVVDFSGSYLESIWIA
jgi:hypothetical protein